MRNLKFKHYPIWRIDKYNQQIVNGGWHFSYLQTPAQILQKVKSQKCFIAGGGKIYSRFYPFLTHLYITPHPYVFGKGVKLFSDIVNEAEVVFENLIQVNENKGIYQYQYKVKQK